ncbi:MAG TPA: hypothetical protein HPQ00_09020, partial [Magnetococcales bacterium]|nr:hypothetical protein [Magnetococcales bacterium]
GVLVATLLFYLEMGWELPRPGVGYGGWAWLPLVLVYALGILMVSNVRFRSMKDMDWHKSRPFLTLVGVVVFLAVLTIHLAVTLFLLSWVYLASAFHSHREYRRLLAEGKEVEEDEVKDFTV